MASPARVSVPLLTRALSQVREIWQSRTLNERRLIAFASALILLATSASLVDWLSSERKRLARLLPRLELQMAGMEAAAKELAELRLQPVVKVATPSLHTSAAAATTRVKEQGLSLTVTESAEAIGIHGTAPFDQSMQLLGILHKENGLRLQKAEILRQENGQASLAVVLAPSSRH
ncbi:MAG: type II secretion system protein GspM [Azonexus sp.]|nr:type II secretion system protein GspM [Azonexus sp.]